MYNINEILDLAESGLPASFIRDELGLAISVRQVQRLIHDRLGARPTRREIGRREPVRDRVGAYMESTGLDRYYCVEGHRSFHECLIREVERDLDLGSLAFVCRKHSLPSDR